MKLSSSQRVLLWGAAVAGFVVVNGMFLYAALFRPGEMAAAHSNLYALAFILEAFILLPLFCFLIAVAELSSPGWRLFLLLSILGSLAFSIPVSILWWSRKKSHVGA